VSRCSGCRDLTESRGFGHWLRKVRFSRNPGRGRGSDGVPPAQQRGVSRGPDTWDQDRRALPLHSRRSRRPLGVEQGWSARTRASYPARGPHRSVDPVQPLDAAPHALRLFLQHKHLGTARGQRTIRNVGPSPSGFFRYRPGVALRLPDEHGLAADGRSVLRPCGYSGRRRISATGDSCSNPPGGSGRGLRMLRPSAAGDHSATILTAIFPGPSVNRWRSRAGVDAVQRLGGMPRASKSRNEFDLALLRSCRRSPRGRAR